MHDSEEAVTWNHTYFVPTEENYSSRAAYSHDQTTSRADDASFRPRWFMKSLRWDSAWDDCVTYSQHPKFTVYPACSALQLPVSLTLQPFSAVIHQDHITVHHLQLEKYIFNCCNEITRLILRNTTELSSLNVTYIWQFLGWTMDVINNVLTEL